ncbi:hypothetical protein [Klebsiella pneumoniae IS33]|nr:hypothetical protein [Klebsiella pneumoniae IS33]
MLFLTIVTQRVAERGAAGALPGNGRVNRFAAVAIPANGGFPLVADSQRGDVFRATWATALAITVSEAVTSASPDCSTQPSRGVWIASGCENLTITLPRLSSTTALALVVPSSRAMMNSFAVACIVLSSVTRCPGTAKTRNISHRLLRLCRPCCDISLSSF